jgi:hypothetical protein
MDIKKALKTNPSSKICHLIASLAISDKYVLDSLIHEFLYSTFRVTQHATKPLLILVKKNPFILNPYLAKMIRSAKQNDSTDSIKRNTLRLLQFAEIPKKHQGNIANLCFRFLENRRTPVAIRVFSTAVLGKVAMDNPGLKDEIITLVEDGIPYSTPAYVSRAYKVVRKLK